MIKRNLIYLVVIWALGSILNSGLARADIFSTSLTDGSRFAFVPSKTEPKVIAFDVHKQRVVKAFELGFIPGDVVVSDLLDVMFVANPDAESMTAVFLVNGEIGKTLDLGMRPDQMILNPGDQYAAIASRDGSVSVWNLRNIKTIFRHDGFSAGLKLSFSTDGTRLFVAEPALSRITVVDLNQGQVDKAIELNSTGQAGDISALSRSADGQTGLVSLTSENKLAVIDLRSLTLRQVLSVGQAPQRPYSTSDGRFILVPNRDDKTLSVLSGLTFDTLATINLQVDPKEINVGWFDTVAFVMPESGQHIDVVNLQTLTYSGQVDLPGQSDNGLITSDGKYLVSALQKNDAVAVIDTRKHLIDAIVPTEVSGLAGISIGVSNNVCH